MSAYVLNSLCVKYRAALVLSSMDRILDIVDTRSHILLILSIAAAAVMLDLAAVTLDPPIITWLSVDIV